jgi:hypothetical protein
MTLIYKAKCIMDEEDTIEIHDTGLVKMWGPEYLEENAIYLSSSTAKQCASALHHVHDVIKASGDEDL